MSGVLRDAYITISNSTSLFFCISLRRIFLKILYLCTASNVICCSVSVHLPLAFEISTWVCVCVRRRDYLGVRSEDSPTCELVLVENNSQWRGALPDREDY